MPPPYRDTSQTSCDAKVQLMTSWTRSSPEATGRLGVGAAFLKGSQKQLRIPTDGVSAHTHGLFLGIIAALKEIRADKSFEIELPHALLCYCFFDEARDAKPANRGFGYGETPLNYKVTISKKRWSAMIGALRAVNSAVKTGAVEVSCANPATEKDSFVPEKVLDRVDELMQKRFSKKSATVLNFLSDCGRYFSREMTLQRPAGVVAAKRRDAAKVGAFVMQRGHADNADLLEVRFAAWFDEGRGGQRTHLAGLDRVRDISLFELLCLHLWSRKLEDEQCSLPRTGAPGTTTTTNTTHQEDRHARFWSPEILSDHDPGVFWNCVRYCGVSNDPSMGGTSSPFSAKTGWARSLFNTGAKESHDFAHKLAVDVANVFKRDLTFLSPSEAQEIALQVTYAIADVLPKLPGFERSKFQGAIALVAPEAEKGSDLSQRWQERDLLRRKLEAAKTASPELRKFFELSEKLGPDAALAAIPEAQREDFAKFITELTGVSDDRPQGGGSGAGGNVLGNKRGVSGPAAVVALNGQQKSCWKCKNVIFLSEEHQSAGVDEIDPSCVCPKCKVATYCCSLHLSQHAAEHFDECVVLRDEEPEDEGGTSARAAEIRAKLVACMVLPADPEVKPYVRYLPRDVRLAIPKIKQLVGSEVLEQLTPYRGFTNPAHMPFPQRCDHDHSFNNAQAVLIQGSWGEKLAGQEVEIEGLTSVAGKALNGKRGCKLTGVRAINKSVLRWCVAVPDGAGEKALNGANLKSAGSVGCAASKNMPRQNMRASCIATPLSMGGAAGGATTTPGIPAGLINAFYVDGSEERGGRSTELGVRCRGDVIAVRVQNGLLQPLLVPRRDEGSNSVLAGDAANSLLVANSEAVLADFDQPLYSKTWGIFSYVALGAGRSASGSIFADDERGRAMLTQSNRMMMDAFEGRGTRNAPAGATGHGASSLDGASLAAGLTAATQKVREQDNMGFEDPEQEPESLVGKRVRVTNLENQQHYNGLMGKVVRQDPESGRFLVEVEYDGEPKTLNLRKDKLMMGGGPLGAEF